MSQRPQMDSESLLNMYRKSAKELVQAEERGENLDKFDFSLMRTCARCQKRIDGKPLRCSACKGVIYCSKECSKIAWNNGLIPGAPPHKELCADNKRHMERISVTEGILAQFPWGRIEVDGTFADKIVRARFDVLGGKGYGFWSERGGFSPHQPGDQPKLPNVSAPILKKLDTLFDHLDGCDLLEKQHLTDEQGWKIPSDHLPRRDFANFPDKRPVLVTDFTEPISSWDAWHRWRKIPKASIASHLMTYPLSVYHLLTHSLAVTNPKAGNPDKRVHLTIHLIGLEKELNFLPIFSELALLLPYHDISVVAFGPGVQKIVSAAKSKPDSVVGRSSLDKAVFSYTAPPECGSGHVSIILAGEVKLWDKGCVPSNLAPDVLIGLDAGLATYPEWRPVIQAAHHWVIPFAATEYLEQSAETQRQYMPFFLQGKTFIKPRAEYPIDLNPFHRPGQRALGTYRMPNMVNGFTIVVVKK